MQRQSRDNNTQSACAPERNKRSRIRVNEVKIRARLDDVSTHMQPFETLHDIQNHCVAVIVADDNSAIKLYEGHG